MISRGTVIQSSHKFNIGRRLAAVPFAVKYPSCPRCRLGLPCVGLAVGREKVREKEEKE